MTRKISYILLILFSYNVKQNEDVIDKVDISKFNYGNYCTYIYLRWIIKNEVRDGASN